jgi:hypothetical protein
MRWISHAARIEEMGNAYNFLKENDPADDLGVDRRTILECNLVKWD